MWKIKNVSPKIGNLLKDTFKYLTYSKYKYHKPVNYLDVIKKSNYINYKDIKDKMSYRKVKHINCNIADEKYYTALKSFNILIKKLEKNLKIRFELNLYYILSLIKYIVKNNF